MPTASNTRMTCKLAGAEVMVVSCLQKESLSQPFHVELEVYEHCLTMKKISYQDMLDKEAEITYWSGKRPVRHINGVIYKIAAGRSPNTISITISASQPHCIARN